MRTRAHGMENGAHTCPFLHGPLLRGALHIHVVRKLLRYINI